MNPSFTRALDQFQLYSMTISGDIGDAIRQCQQHLEQFLATAQETVTAEQSDDPSRLGRPKPFQYGEGTLDYQVFN